jgi:quinol monooxygenase YgiN
VDGYEASFHAPTNGWTALDDKRSVTLIVRRKREDEMPGAVAEITVKEGSQAEFEKLAMEMEAAVNANEPGIIFYRLFKVQGESNKYVFLEQYKDTAAVEAHRAAEHFKRIGRAMGAHMDGPPKVTRMDKVK